MRELENAIERAVLVAKGSEMQPARSARADSRRGEHRIPEFSVPPHHTLAEIEKMAILQTLQRTNWNKQEAAHILGLYRPTLYSKMRKHNIEDPGRAARAAREARRSRELASRAKWRERERTERHDCGRASSAPWPAWRWAICSSPKRAAAGARRPRAVSPALVQEAERLLSAADQVRQSVAELRGSAKSGWPRSA